LILEELKIINNNKDITFLNTSLNDIEYFIYRMLLPEEEVLLKEKNLNRKEFIFDAFNNSKEYFTVKYKGTPILIFGVNECDYKGKEVIWILPDTKSDYKLRLTKICKRFIKDICNILGSVITFEAKRVKQGLRWIKAVGGNVIGDINFDDLDFHIVEFGGK
jgi:hypothetical protein